MRNAFDSYQAGAACLLNGATILAILETVAKIFGPFLFALLLIWAKEYIVTIRENRLKQDALWRILIEKPSALATVLEGYEDMIQSYERDEISTRMFLNSEVPSVYFRRLAELDHQYAHVYSELEIETEGLWKRDAILDQLREQFYKEPDRERRVVLAGAIREEARKGIEQTFSFLERELEVLKRIQKARNKDEQQLRHFGDAIEEGKRRSGKASLGSV